MRGNELNREEIMHLLRKHTATFAGMIQENYTVPVNVLATGGGSQNIGGLNRINELFEMLKALPKEQQSTGNEGG